MFERKTILDRLQNNDNSSTTNKNKEVLTFARLLEEGKVSKAIQIFEKAKKGGILPLSDETYDILQQEHPEAPEASDDRLLKETPHEMHPDIYESINLEMIRYSKKDNRSCRSFRNGR